jgi:MFS family permease
MGKNERALARQGAPPRATLAGLARLIVPPIALPVFIASADGTAVATALPSIGAAFGAADALQWIIVANLIAGTIAAPVYGRLGDHLGRKRLMLISLGMFVGASAMCAAAPSLVWLLVARALQGAGGGGLITLSQALLGATVPARQLGRFQGYFSAFIVAGSSFGPVAGGLLTQSFGWHAVFLANVPLGLAAMLLVRRLPAGEPRNAGFALDLPGIALLALLVVPLLLALRRVRVHDAAEAPAIAALLAVAGVALAALVWQQRRSPAPLLALGLLREPAIWRANVMSACSGASLVAMVTFLPIYFQVVTGANPAVSGLLLLPLTAGVSVGSVLTGWMVSRTGRTAVFPGVGLIGTALTLIALAFWAPRMSLGTISVLLAVGGLCQGTSMLVAQVTSQIVAGPGRLGVAAGAIQLARALGSAFGVALSGAVLFAGLAWRDPATAVLFGEMVRQGPRLLAALPPARHALVQGEIGAAFAGVFLTVACFSCTIVAMAWTQPVRRLDR